MKHANKYGFPIVTFIDTPGAFAGKEAEERGQGEAIAYNLREMFGLTVPMVSIVLGEGGSGGALAIGCPNRMLIMEHGVYYVASPEACAAILWKSKDKSEAATNALRITSKDMVKLGIADEVILEPPGASHSDPMSTFPAIKTAILKHFNEFANMTQQEILEDRYFKFRQIGMYEKFHVPAGMWSEFRDMRASASPLYTANGAVAFSEEEKDEVEKEEQGRRDFEELLLDQKRQQYIRRPQELPRTIMSNLNDKSAWFLLREQEEKIQQEKEQQEQQRSQNGSENGAGLEDASKSLDKTLEQLSGQA